MNLKVFSSNHLILGDRNHRTFLPRLSDNIYNSTFKSNKYIYSIYILCPKKCDDYSDTNIYFESFNNHINSTKFIWWTNRGIGFPLLTLGTAYRVLHACFLLKRIIEEHALFYFTIYTVVRASASTMLKNVILKHQNVTLSILIHQFSNKIIKYYTQL